MIALLFAPDCTVLPEETAGASDTTSVSEEAGEGAVLVAARWTLTWDTSGVTFVPGGGFEVETDEGYRVHVYTARILTHNLAFGPCEAALAARPRRLLPGLPIRAAHAHAENTEPSTIETSLVEDPATAATIEVSSSFSPARYCRAHWLLARPLSPTQGPADIPMEGRSLFVTGTFERGGRRGKVAIDTWWPSGLLVDLQDAVAAEALEEAAADGEPRHAFVTVTRHLGRLFDGIDFETATDDEVAGITIDNLVLGADIDVVLWAPGD